MKSTKMIFLSLSKMTAAMAVIIMAACGENTNGTNGPGGGSETTPPDYLADWQEGYMDIHHISTGQGECSFIICPDGTTILIDAGDVANGWGTSGTPAVPDDSKTPGEWIAAYVNHFSEKLPQPGTLDYVLITHFHSDHIGSPGTAKEGYNGYKLGGITMVGEHVMIKKFIDRGWPDYTFPSRALTESSTGGFWNDYYGFLNYKKNNGMEIEKFDIGSNSQFVLTHKTSTYSDFSIRNIYANGQLWTGSGSALRTLYTASDTAADENMHSCVVTMTYGPFVYYSGGDIPGYNHANYASQNREIEAPVSEVVGKVTVMKANHHGTYDSTPPALLRNMTPCEIIIPSAHVLHPDGSALLRMIDPLVYEGDRNIYTTRYTSGHTSQLGGTGNVIKPAGHIVVRVYMNGTKYQMFVLDSEKTDYPIIYSSEIMTTPVN